VGLHAFAPHRVRAGPAHRWAERVEKQAWSDAYVFFKHEDRGRGRASRGVSARSFIDGAPATSLPFVLVTLLRTLMVFSMLTALKYVSRIFFRYDISWVGDVPPDPWGRLRLVAFSTIPPLRAGLPRRRPQQFRLALAAHGVVRGGEDNRTAACRDHFQVRAIMSSPSHASATTRVSGVEPRRPKSMVVIAPEGA